MVKMVCAVCAMEFGVSEEFVLARLGDGGGIFCPQGHENVFGKQVLKIVEWKADLEDLARRGAAIYEEWKADPSCARPYAEFRDELVEEGKLEAGG